MVRDARAWLSALRARADRPPLRPRVPLWAGDARIGSVEPDFIPRVPMPAGIAQEVKRGSERGWSIVGDVTDALHKIAMGMREAGLAHAWRDEQLAVTDEKGRVHGTVERAVVRPLGITTFAVHLVGMTSDGRHWLQQRSLTKPNDPGLWDTLMGGMIPASDSLEVSLARETWEEAGLRLPQLQALAHGGRITTRRPTGEGRSGYVVEHIDWYRCIVPHGVVPENQDGEVQQFRLVPAGEVASMLLRDEFTVEAALILLQAGLELPAGVSEG